MKRNLLIALLMTGTISLFAEDVKTYTASIEHATVFVDGAELLHKVSLPLQAGDNTVRIENISPLINEESLQIALGGGVIVQNYNFSLDYLSADKKKMSTAALEDSLKMAQNALQEAERRLSTIAEMQKLLQAGVNSSLTATTGVTTATIDKNLQYFRTNALELAKQADATKEEKAALEKRIKALQQQIKENGGRKFEKSGIVTLQVNSPKKQTIAANVKYYTPAAAWEATYDLNITDLHSPIGLIMKAHVFQFTGIEWKNVRLTLSTNTPSSNNVAPELSTWWLQQEVQRTMLYGARSAKSTTAYSLQNEVAGVEVLNVVEDEAPAVAQSTIQRYVSAEQQALSVEYAISLPYTIDGNGKDQTIALLERQIEDVTFNYYAAPSADAHAYLVAYITNWQKEQLPDGRANLTYAGTYFGETLLATNNDEARVRLTLGDDKQIKIKRERTTANSKTSGNTKQVTYGYTTTVRNDKSEAVSITLKDRYPVSAAKDIQVSVSDKSTPATTESKANGMLTYELNLQPGETRTIELIYTVKYPKDWRINL